MCECKQAKQQECLPRECLVQDKTHTEKKALQTAYILDPTFTISKACNKEKQFVTVCGQRNYKQ